MNSSENVSARFTNIHGITSRARKFVYNTRTIYIGTHYILEPTIYIKNTIYWNTIYIEFQYIYTLEFRERLELRPGLDAVLFMRRT